MKTTRPKFILLFLVAAFVFQFLSNALLGPEVRLFPADGEWFPGMESAIGWQHTLAQLVYPVKYVLIKPLSFLAQEPDAPPPLLVIAFTIYWGALAWVLYLLTTRIIPRKPKASAQA